MAAYHRAGFGHPGEAEVRSWNRSWPPLLDALVRAGLQDLWIYLEFVTPSGDNRFDALLLGQRGEKDLVSLVVELKQWTEARPLSGGRVRLPWDGSVKPHPVVQVAGYTGFLTRWFASEELELDVRGLVYLHEADEGQAEVFRGLSHGPYGCPVLSGEQLSESTSEDELRALLLCSDVRAPGDEAVKTFEASPWRPDRELLTTVADTIERRPSFALIGDQQAAFLEIRARVAEASSSDRRSIVLVQGGPGSGKTVLAVRLLGSFFESGEHTALYRTQSGTLTGNLRKVTKSVHGAQQIFGAPWTGVPKEVDLVILDEAHRLERSRGGFASLVNGNYRNASVVVVFLDERQQVRPYEGLEAAEVQQVAERSGIDLITHELRGSFRCNGSRRFATWVDDLLYSDPEPWQGDDYDLGSVGDPSQMEQWLQECLQNHHSARISAGYCWSWSRPAPGLNLPGVNIEWFDPRTGEKRHFAKPWNLRKEQHGENGEPLAPASQFWATDPGGVHQIGCVYTAQGLEYQGAGVIFGPDLVRREGQWIADPRQSQDPVMRSLNSQEYLPLAKNIYRVLMTRGMSSCRLYSTDEETQAFLASLVPMASTWPQGGVPGSSQ
ncbi:DNA/RNA helicase domain-containing protein [Nocardiopsis xinjiangensis]|uniref:DNA/RNA helicase domain-containing protein n=1 Tax=Nocardiopsis xinjiangensis TaxID=124285 RepID=UPI001F4D1EB4|nr:DNA/RNA helicase domain-containing protein [Nocardiopsis xinjiangensis]